MYPDCEKGGEQNAKLVKSAQNTAMLYGQKKARKTRAGNFGQALFFDFPVERSALEGRVVLHLLNFFLRLAEIARRHVARGRLAFLARFGAFDYNCFSGHCIPLLKI